MAEGKLFLLGVLQGITEFLPISSSGHLFLMEKFLDLNQDSLSFAIFVHGATLLSLITVFFKSFIKLPFTEQTRKLGLKILLGSIPIAILGLFFKSSVNQTYGNLTISLGFILTGCLFVLVFMTSEKNRNLNSLNFKEALFIGGFQALCALPGFSRSGWTIAIALLMGFSPKSSYTFSFLLALPALLGAFLMEGANVSFSFSSQWIGAFVGAYLAGTLSLYLLLFILKKRKLYYFSFYLIPLGLYLLLF